MIEMLEPDAALGNGGLGRLAACFMESMATVDIPAYGYGIRYDHGLFRQEISDGCQVELPEDWLSHGNPWEFERREAAYEIGFGGIGRAPTRTTTASRSQIWQPQEKVLAVAFDTPIVGWRGKRVNTLRLWSARASTRSSSTPSTAATIRRARRADPGGDDHPRPLSGRLDAGRPGAAAAPGIFLHLGLAAGPPPPPPPAVRHDRATSPTRSRSSSTTPIRRSPSPS